MENELIRIEELCAGYDIQISFIEAVNEVGLIDIVTVENQYFVSKEHLINLEKIIRLHYDLNINFEGIDVIYNLLRRVDELQGELNNVKRRLQLYQRNE